MGEQYNNAGKALNARHLRKAGGIELPGELNVLRNLLRHKDSEVRQLFEADKSWWHKGSSPWQKPVERPLDAGSDFRTGWGTGIAPGLPGQGIDQNPYSGDSVNTFNEMINTLYYNVVPKGTNPSTPWSNALQGKFSKDGVTYANGGITINPKGSPVAVSANAINQSASIEYNQPGVISAGLYGSWGDDPSIQGNIKIGQQPPQIDTSSPNFTSHEDAVDGALINAGVMPKPIPAQVPIEEKGVHNPLSVKYVHEEGELSPGELFLRNQLRKNGWISFGRDS